MKRVFCLLVGLLLTCSASGEYEEPTLSVALGAKVANRWLVRGATFYDALYVSPLLYIGAFNRRLEFFGNSLEYNDFFINTILRGRGRLSFFGDDPSIVFGEPKGFRNSRASALEARGKLEWFIPNWTQYWGQVDIDVSKGLSGHFGVFIESTVRVTLAKLFKNSEGKANVQPQVFARIGWGDRQQNQYLYGAGAGGAGFNMLGTGIMVVAPAKIDPHYPVLEMGYYQVLGDARRGSLVSDQPQGFGVSATIAFQVFKID